jgi:hypothetical protein
MLIAWSIVALLLAVNVAWLWAGGIPFIPSQTFWSGLAVASLGLLVPIVRIASRRAQSLMPVYSLFADRLALFMNTLAVQVALGLMTLTFTFLATMLGWPLRDQLLSDLDRALGFDWIAFLAMTNANPFIATVLAEAYRTSFPQLLLLFTFLSIAGRAVRLSENWEFLAVAKMFYL